MKTRILILLWLYAVGVYAQVGGLSTYEFLNFAPSARISALGGSHIAVIDDDVVMAVANPAILNETMHQALSFNHAFHPGGIQYGYASGAFHHDHINTSFHAGIRYVNYGDFDLTNTLGQVEGTFSPAEYALTIGAARQLTERLRGGVNLRVVSSQFEAYQSMGLMADVAVAYQDTGRQVVLTLVARNIGGQLRTYRSGNVEPVPYEVQLGVSKRLRHLPFRFSAIYRHMNRWNILYDNPDTQETSTLFGEEPTERSDAAIWLDNFTRHLVFNGELLVGEKENFRLRVGYNWQLRKELSLSQYRSMAGFTFGVGVKVNRFRIDYGRTNLHLGGGVNHLSVSTNIKEFK